ncbi:MAG: preprotein translocase subunit SecD, partial [Solirubrobacteraceae bacterium]
MSDRRRNGLILLLVLGLLIASGIVIATQPIREGLDLKGGVQLVYQGKPTPQQPKVTQEALDRAVDIIRERVDQLGVSEPEIQRAGSDQIEVGLPDVKNAKRAIDTVGTTAQLFFYDWEPNVLGPGCKADPSDSNVTGGPGAGTAGAISQYDAVRRAAECPARKGKFTTDRDQYYLLNNKTERVVAGPQDTEAELFADRAQKKAGPNEEIAVVKPGTVVVQAQQPTGSGLSGKGTDQYYVLRDNVALRGTDIKNPEQNFDQGAGGSGQPIVTFDFTSRGREIWQDVTRRIAQRGQESLNPALGVTPDLARQHFAIVLDNRLVSVPYIDFQQNPDGIDARNGSQIEGGFTIQSAQE